VRIAGVVPSPEATVSSPLQISVMSLPAVFWLQIDGEIERPTRAALVASLTAAVVDERVLVLDARGVTSCDGYGIRLLAATVGQRIRSGQPVHSLLSAEVERLAVLAGADVLVERAGDASLLAELVTHAAGGLEPPVDEWIARRAARLVVEVVPPARRRAEGAARLAGAVADARAIKARSRVLAARSTAARDGARRTCSLATASQRGRMRGPRRP
jgi:anti-anti-sigma regulatory factor